MPGTIKHSWNGTILTIESDSGVSSMDLKGAGGPIGPRGAQGPAGIIVNSNGSVNLNGYATQKYVQDMIAGAQYEGEDGATYTPMVDSSGNLSWSNDGNLPNPQTVNIRGPQGKDGYTPIKGVDYFDGAPGRDGKDGTVSFESLTEAQIAMITGPTGPKGDNFTYDDFTPEQLEALRGPKGADGTMTFADLTEEQKASLKGVDGHTPVKGVDYFTDAEKQEIVNGYRKLENTTFSDYIKVQGESSNMYVYTNGIQGDSDNLWIGSDGEGVFTSLYVSGNAVATQDYVSTAIADALAALDGDGEDY